METNLLLAVRVGFLAGPSGIRAGWGVEVNDRLQLRLVEGRDKYLVCSQGYTSNLVLALRFDFGWAALEWASCIIVTII